jgi:hypothetical protein
MKIKNKENKEVKTVLNFISRKIPPIFYLCNCFKHLSYNRKYLRTADRLMTLFDDVIKI